MIESLKIEIVKAHQKDWPDDFRIHEDYNYYEDFIVKVVKDGVLYERRIPLGDQELELTFDQMWDEAKIEMLKFIKERELPGEESKPREPLRHQTRGKSIT